MSHPVKIQSGANRTWVPWLIALCLIGIPLLAIPLLFRIDALSAAVLRQIEHRIGHEISVRVQDSSTTARLLSANRMELVLQALPLLRGQIVGNRLMIERPHLEIQRDAAGRWTLGTATLRPASPQAQTENPFALFALVRNVLLTDGRVTVTDHAGSGVKKVPLLTALQVIISEGQPGRTATVQVQGEMGGGSEAAVFGVEGTVIQSRTAESEQTAAPPYPLQFDGTVRLDKLNVQHVVDWAGWASVMDGARGPARFSGRIRFVPRADGYDLIVPEWTAEVRDLSLRGDASLTGLNMESLYRSKPC